MESPYLIETRRFREGLLRHHRYRYLTRPDMRYVDIDGHGIRVRDSGGKHGAPCLVLTADSPILIEHHDRLFELLTPSMRVVCFDVPGFGFSIPHEAFDFRLDSYAALIEQLLDQLGVGRCTLSFPCFTAYMGMKLAQRLPHRIEQLILPQAPDWAGELAWFRLTGLGILTRPTLGQRFMTGLQLHAPGAWLHPWFLLTLNKRQDRRWIRELSLTAAHDGMINCWASIYQCWHGEQPPDFSGIAQPCLSLWGPKDRTHFRTDAESLVRCLPHVECCRFEGAAHYTYLQEPERFARLVQERMTS